MITSSKRRFSVTLDGRFSTEKEWSDATCVDLYMYQENTGSTIGMRWYIKNDAQWLYLIARVPKKESMARGVAVNSFWPDYVDGRWAFSDSGGVEYNPDPITFDQYHWDETRWFPDTSSPSKAKNDVDGTISEDDQYIYFEFRKPLKSGEAEDWAWEPGTWVGTDITGALLFITWNDTTWYGRNVKLNLSD